MIDPLGQNSNDIGILSLIVVLGAIVITCFSLASISGFDISGVLRKFVK